MSLAQRIRRAALWPRPYALTYHVMSWLRDEWILPDYLLHDFVRMRTDTERRMFLLFAAEDLGDCGDPWDDVARAK